MADFGAPVAQNIQTPDPVKTLSGLIGIKSGQLQLQQQQQNLDTGAFNQQTSQAAAQEAQQKMSERQLLQKSLLAGKDPDGNALTNPDGTNNTVAIAQFASKHLPLTGQDVSQHIIKTQDDQIKLNDSSRSLSDNYRNDLSGIVRSAINGNTAAALPAIDQYVQQNGGDKAPPPLIQAAASAKSLLQNASAHPDQQGQNKGIIQLAQQLQPPAATAAQQTPAISTYTNAGGNTQPYNANPYAPGGVGDVGHPFTTGIAPQMITPPGGIPIPYKGGGGLQNPTAAPHAVQPTDQDMSNFSNYTTGLNHRVETATDVIPRIDLAEQALDSIRTGAGTEARMGIAKKLQAFGMNGLADAVSGGDLGKAQVAEKLLFQTTFAGLKQSMQGDPARVSEFNAAEGVFPSVGTDPRATKDMLNFMKGQSQRDSAEQQALNNARKTGQFNGQPFSPATWQADYQSGLRAGKVPGVPSNMVPSEEKTPSTQEGAISKSKSGKPIVFKNGRWEYQ